ncbi:MAG: DUF2059 domain-containing protein [Pseudomonadota bacterium]
MKSIAFCLLLLCLAGPPAAAEAVEGATATATEDAPENAGDPPSESAVADATYIVEQTVTERMFIGALTRQRPLILAAVKRELDERKIDIADREAFMDVFFDEFVAEFTRVMQGRISELFAESLTEEELSVIAAFYATPSGQALVEKTPPIMEKATQFGAEAGLITHKNVLPKVAARLEAESLLNDEDPQMMVRLMDYLR